MALIGYARVSTGEQKLDPQRDDLRVAGCTIIHEEHASGADRARPALGRLLGPSGRTRRLSWCAWTGWPARCRISLR